MLKDDLNNREFTGKVLTSAGMGKQYLNAETGNSTSTTERTQENTTYSGMVLEQ